MAVLIPAGIAVRGPAVPTPVRRPGSVRRTSTIDATWPEGAVGTPMHLLGRARDLLTPTDGSQPIVLAEDIMRAVVGPDRTTTQLSSEPNREQLAVLVGVQGGGGSRRRVVEALPDEVEAGTPLYLLLDDLSGATLVSGFGFRHWEDHTEPPALPGGDIQARKLRLVNICAGFQEGASALGADGMPPAVHQVQPVPDLERADDPWAWHALLDVTGVSSRRSRRIDVWREGDEYVIDAFFQDAGTSPSGSRIAVHEYTLKATVEVATGLVTSIEAIPQVLPFNECPMATIAVGRLVGHPIRGFRTIVNEQLPGTDGCTHMNDALRALAEVPVLAAQLA